MKTWTGLGFKSLTLYSDPGTQEGPGPGNICLVNIWQKVANVIKRFFLVNYDQVFAAGKPFQPRPTFARGVEAGPNESPF
jgi:hypothetical protein